MAHQDDGSDFNPSTRGDSAWKEARACGLAQCRSPQGGKAEREAYERQRASGPPGGRGEVARGSGEPPQP